MKFMSLIKYKDFELIDLKKLYNYKNEGEEFKIQFTYKKNHVVSLNYKTLNIENI